jgi:hypothetical protein
VDAVMTNATVAATPITMLPIVSSVRPGRRRIDRPIYLRSDMMAAPALRVRVFRSLRL